jgi:hypothetical protein
VATFGDAKDRGAAGEHAPERAPAAAQPPAGLVDVEGRGGADVPEQILVGFVERLSGVLHDGVDRARGDRGSEELSDELDRVAAGDAVAHREGGDRRLQARAEGAPGHGGRQRGARHGAALRAAQTLEAVLAHRDRDRGQLHDLMAGGLAHGATLRLAEAVAAGAALGPALDELIERFDGRQMTTASGMARLGTLAAP